MVDDTEYRVIFALHTCNLFYSVLNLSRQSCVLFRYDKKKSSPSLEFAHCRWGGKGSKNKVGANVFSVYGDWLQVMNFQW